MTLNIWKYFDITHRDHIFCNPTSVAKFEQIMAMIRLEPGARVLELATGKGEFITRMAERQSIKGTAIDISPFCIRDASAKFQARDTLGEVEFLEMNGAKYQPKEPASFDLTACIGASWIFAGHEGTLRAMNEMTKPGGYIIVGEPFWLQPPDPEYLKSAELDAHTFGSHYENVLTGERIGLKLLFTIGSNQDEWDTYEGLQWNAAENYAVDHPEDPDLAEILKEIDGKRREYLRWGRQTLGWAVYLFRKPA